MPSDSTAALHANFSRRQFDLVMKHHDIALAELEEIRSLLHRTARLVHVGRGCEENDAFGVQYALGGLALIATAPRFKTVTPRHVVENHEPDIVPVAFVLRSGISQPDEQAHGIGSLAGLLLLLVAAGRRGLGGTGCRSLRRTGSGSRSAGSGRRSTGRRRPGHTSRLGFFVFVGWCFV